jgi:hypothetical protein
LKRSTIFVLVPYSDSVYKIPKIHFDLLREKTPVDWKQGEERIHGLTCTPLCCFSGCFKRVGESSKCTKRNKEEEGGGVPGERIVKG